MPNKTDSPAPRVHPLNIAFAAVGANGTGGFVPQLLHDMSAALAQQERARERAALGSAEEHR